MIPEDWKIEKLGDCLLGMPQYGINAPAVQYTDSLPTYIRITDITDDSCFSPENIASVRHVGADKYVLKDGDLVFARTGASVGKTYLYKPEDGNLVFAGYLIRVKVNPSKLLPSYLAAYVKTENYWNWVRAMSMRSGQPGINSTEYAQLPIPLPSLPEQQAIATALSDVDALITSLDRLIAKKRNIKQATMQQLLTGKKRLPGFSDEWSTKYLRDISFMKGRIGWQGLKQSEFTMNADEPYLITGMNFKNGKIRWDEVYHVSNERYDIAKDIQLESNDILMTKDGTMGKLLFVDIIPFPGKATLNSHLLVFRPIRDSYDPKFLYYQLASKAFKDYIELSKSGSTFFGVSQESVGNYPVFLPPTKSEQTLIATILSDMDAEIVALEEKRDKMRALKQGMMQELLTGKTRVI